MRRDGDPDGGLGAAARDRWLVARVRAGDAGAADELVSRHLPRAYRAALLVVRDPHRAEDVVQDAFERALRAIGRFDPARPFAPWLHRIVVNTAIDHLRRRDEPSELVEELHPGRDPYDMAEASRELVGAIGALPEERRVVVVLRLVCGYSPHEVAEILDVRVGTVHSRLSRGLEQLRTQLGVSGEV